MKGEGAEEGHYLICVLSGCIVKSCVSVTGIRGRQKGPALGKLWGMISSPHGFPGGVLRKGKIFT